MITYKTTDDIALMKKGGSILAAALLAVQSAVKPGIGIHGLDRIAREYIESHGGAPAFLGYGTARGVVGYPSTLCISINDEVVHGIGIRDIVLHEGDIVGLDIGTRYPANDGLYTDMAVTVGVGKISVDAQSLIDVTRVSLDRAIALVRPGISIHEISKEVQGYCEGHGYSLIRDLTGHGVGFSVHEDPPVPNYFDERMPDVILKEGMVICIEPMVAMGDWHVFTDTDEWTVRTADHSLAAHFEHTIAVTAGGHEILTLA
ncbi:MAG: type I methionyl aminopeptidase [bacterium]|nr:type I methionyl aminopeptidase [bacterium]